MDEYTLRDLNELKEILHQPSSIYETLHEIVYENCKEYQWHDESTELQSCEKFESRNGHTWYQEYNIQPEETKFEISGPIPGRQTNAMAPCEYWKLLITDVMREHIVQSTNAKLAVEIHMRRHMPNLSDILDFLPLTLHEFDTFIGLIYIYGLENIQDNSLSLDNWLKNNYLARSTMKASRFHILFRFLRFDHEANMIHLCNCNQPILPILKIWESFFSSCQNQYRTSRYCTVDEQMYDMTNMPGVENIPKAFQNQITLVVLNDARTGYLLNAILCFLIDDGYDERYYYMTKLLQSIAPNVTLITNKRFTSVYLIRQMFDNNNITITGAVKECDECIPDILKCKREVGSSIFCSDRHMSLVSHIPRENKIILLLSSLYRRSEVNREGRPKVVDYYKETRGGVNYFHQLCKQYSTRINLSSNVTYWPMMLFLGILDQACVNALILYTCNSKNEKLSKRIFLEKLAMGLIAPKLYGQSIF